MEILYDRLLNIFAVDLALIKSYYNGVYCAHKHLQGKFKRVNILGNTVLQYHLPSQSKQNSGLGPSWTHWSSKDSCYQSNALFILLNLVIKLWRKSPPALQGNYNEAMEKGSDTRYLGDKSKLKIAQGVSGVVADKGSVLRLIPYTTCAVKQGFQDLGLSSLQDAHNNLFSLAIEHFKLSYELSTVRSNESTHNDR